MRRQSRAPSRRAGRSRDSPFRWNLRGVRHPPRPAVARRWWWWRRRWRTRQGARRRQLRSTRDLSRALSRRADGTVTALGEAQTHHGLGRSWRDANASARTAAIEYQDKVAKLQRSFTGALEQANKMAPRRRRFGARSSTRRPISSCWTRRAGSITACSRSSARCAATKRCAASSRAIPSSIQDRVNSAVRARAA